MKHKFFSIPVCSPEQAEAVLNKFCDQHRVVDIEKQGRSRVSSANESSWDDRLWNIQCKN